jgi:Ca2+-binding RTX toxin-like protein
MDTITGGAGADTISGGDGSDTIDVVDGTKENVVVCDEGFDHVRADLADGDAIRSDCEFVDVMAVDDGDPSHALVHPLAVAGDDSTVVPVVCPQAARIDCHGRVSLLDAKHRTTVLATASYEVPMGTTRKVGVRLPHSSADALRSSHQVVVQTLEQGVSLKGPRHALRLVSVRRSQSHTLWWVGAIGAAALVVVTGLALWRRRAHR